MHKTLQNKGILAISKFHHLTFQSLTSFRNSSGLA